MIELWIEIIKTGQRSESIGALILIISLVVEKLPTRIKPWTMALRWVGKLMNAGLSEQVSNLEKMAMDNREQIGFLSRTLMEHRALVWRYNIQNFADNLRLGLRRTDAQFDMAIKDIGQYEKYCDDNGIKNHVIEEAKAYILSRYREQKNI